MRFIHNDGGRKDAGFKGETRDCVVRAIAIASDLPYRQVYDDLNEHAKKERPTKRARRSSSRDGVHRKTYDPYLLSLGFVWTPTMQIGSGCKVHLHDGELPDGRLIIRLSKHLTAVIDGVIHDTDDPQRNYQVVEDGVQRTARRCVYGYWRKEE